MSWNDDRIARAMQKIDPAATPPDALPGPAEWTRMRGITAAPARRKLAGRPVLRWAWALPVVAIVAVVAVVSLTLGTLTVTPSYASTPPTLVAEPFEGSIEQVVAASVQTLRSASPGTATRDAQVVRWMLRDDAPDDPVIVPEWQEWVWNDDGTGQLTSIAGAPYSVTDDGQIVAPAGEAPEEGTPINRSDGYHSGYFPEEPPSDTTALRDYMQDHVHVADDADTLAWWGAISALRDEWTLTPSQQAAALEILHQAGGLSVLGSVMDRFGREGIALSVSSTDREQFGATIVLDVTSRQVIAADILYFGGLGRLDIEPHSVIQYSAWLLP